MKLAEMLQNSLGDVSTDKQYVRLDVPMLQTVADNGASYLKEK